LAVALVLPPAPTARLNDYAGLLSPAERQRIEALLTERERATGTQMAIAVFKSLDGENLEDVANRLFQQWRLGQKKLDNGVLLVVFIEDRKLRIEVGYGLEGALPDAEASQIIRNVIVPRFRERQYAAGLEAATVAVFERIKPGSTPEELRRLAQPAQRRQQSGGPNLYLLILLAFMAVAVGGLPWEASPQRGHNAGPRGRGPARGAGEGVGRGGGGARGGGGGGGGWGGGGGLGGGGGGGGGVSGGGGSSGGGGASGSW